VKLAAKATPEMIRGKGDVAIVIGSDPIIPAFENY
jgi:hypothetical protein